MRLLFILAAIPASLFGQDQKFFTKHFQNVTDRRTDNIRSYTFENGTATITDVSQDTIVQKMVIDGAGNDINKINEFAWYCTQGGNDLNYKAHFQNLKGDLELYEKGKMRAQVIVHDKEYKYGQVWNQVGEKLLENGSGNNIHLSDDKSEIYYEHYEDSLLVMHYGIRCVEKDTIHYKVDRMAAPKEGFQKFLKSLVKVLTYPGIARLAGKEGLIYVQFIVGRNGELVDFKPLSNKGYNFEDKTIKKLKKLHSWNPAIFKNTAVKQRFVLPVKFKLI